MRIDFSWGIPLFDIQQWPYSAFTRWMLILEDEGILQSTGMPDHSDRHRRIGLCRRIRRMQAEDAAGVRVYLRRTRPTLIFNAHADGAPARAIALDDDRSLFRTVGS